MPVKPTSILHVPSPQHSLSTSYVNELPLFPSYIHLPTSLTSYTTVSWNLVIFPYSFLFPNFSVPSHTNFLPFHDSNSHQPLHLPISPPIHPLIILLIFSPKFLISTTPLSFFFPTHQNIEPSPPLITLRPWGNFPLFSSLTSFLCMPSHFRFSSPRQQPAYPPTTLSATASISLRHRPLSNHCY